MIATEIICRETNDGECRPTSYSLPEPDEPGQRRDHKTNRRTHKELERKDAIELSNDENAAGGDRSKDTNDGTRKYGDRESEKRHATSGLALAFMPKDLIL